MQERSPDVPDKLTQFLDDVAAVDVRVEYLASLNLKWDQPAGKPVNLGIVTRSGEIWTDATSWTVDRDLAVDYNRRLAQLFGGKVRYGTTKKVPRLWVARPDGTPFRIEDVADRLSAWTGIIEEFQNAVRVRAQDRET